MCDMKAAAPAKPLHHNVVEIRVVANGYSVNADPHPDRFAYREHPYVFETEAALLAWLRKKLAKPAA